MDADAVCITLNSIIMWFHARAENAHVEYAKSMMKKVYAQYGNIDISLNHRQYKTEVIRPH